MQVHNFIFYCLSYIRCYAIWVTFNLNWKFFVICVVLILTLFAVESLELLNYLLVLHVGDLQIGQQLFVVFVIASCINKSHRYWQFCVVVYVHGSMEVSISIRGSMERKSTSVLRSGVYSPVYLFFYLAIFYKLWIVQFIRSIN